MIGRTLPRWLALGVCFLLVGAAFADEPENPDIFQLGIWADDSRTFNCVEGPPGGPFSMVGWGWVPDNLGLSYITYRFDFPPNVTLVGSPVLPRDVLDLIVTEFADGTVEWNILFSSCDSGWVRVFTQEGDVLDGERATIRIVEDRCWMRDCTLVLNTVTVAGEIVVNDPGCGLVPVEHASWGTVKGWYR